MRLFVAIDLPASVKDELMRAADLLRPLAPDAKWVPRENLHLTVKFIGEARDETLPDISAAIGRVAAGFVDFSSSLDRVGCFPSPRRARVLWAGLTDAAGGIAAIASALDEEMAPLGFPPERRAFTAHLTLARLRAPGPLDLPDVGLDPAPFPIDRLTLFRSRLARPAPRYEALTTFPFRREPSPPRPD